jgi:hypothetical protein
MEVRCSYTLLYSPMLCCGERAPLTAAEAAGALFLAQKCSSAFLQAETRHSHSYSTRHGWMEKDLFPIGLLMGVSQ